MNLRRFVLLNAVLVPAIVLAIRWHLESFPLLLYVLAVGYVTFAGLLSIVWLLSQTSVGRTGS